MPALLKLKPDVQIQVFQNGVRGGHFPAEPALCRALQVILPLYMQVCLEQVVHHNEPHLRQQRSVS